MTARSSHGPGHWIAGGTQRVIDRATDVAGGPERDASGGSSWA
jgi:hypothetical protein